jgi:transcriptional regulator with XRE-family HTH domain
VNIKVKKDKDKLIALGQGKRLAKFRIEKGFKSRLSFADALNVSVTTISDIEKNLREISSNLIILITKKWEDTDEQWLLSGKSTELLTIKKDEQGVSEPPAEYKNICLECLRRDKIIDSLRQEVNHWQKKYIDCLEEIAGLKKDVSSG